MSEEPYLWRYRSPEDSIGTDMDVLLLPNSNKSRKPDEDNMTIVTWDRNTENTDKADTPTFEGQVVFQGDYEEL